VLAYHILSDHQAHTHDGTSRQLPLGVYKSPQGHMGTADTRPIEMSAFNGACHMPECRVSAGILLCKGDQTILPPTDVTIEVK